MRTLALILILSLSTVLAEEASLTPLSLEHSDQARVISEELVSITRTTFISQSTLEQLFRQYHNQLLEAGYQQDARTSREAPSPTIEASYTHGDETVNLTLRRSGRSNLFTLTLEHNH